MQPRITGPAISVPGVVVGNDAAETGGDPTSTIELVGRGPNQVDRCTTCRELPARGARKAGETDDRLQSSARAATSKDVDGGWNGAVPSSTC